MKICDYVLMDKKSIFIDPMAKIGTNVIIYENNRIEGESVICDNVTIFPNSLIVNSIIGKGSKIYSSVIEKSRIGERCFIEPFSYLKNVKVESNVNIYSNSRFKNILVSKQKVAEYNKIIKKA